MVHLAQYPFLTVTNHMPIGSLQTGPEFSSILCSCGFQQLRNMLHPSIETWSSCRSSFILHDSAFLGLFFSFLSRIILFIGVVFIESGPYSVSIEMELLVEELKEQHQDLKIQLETKVSRGGRHRQVFKRQFVFKLKIVIRISRLSIYF